MAFIIQHRTNSGKWSQARFQRPQASLDLAIAACLRLDQDGCWPAETRVVDGAGKVVMDGKTWFAQRG